MPKSIWNGKIGHPPVTQVCRRPKWARIWPKHAFFQFSSNKLKKRVFRPNPCPFWPYTDLCDCWVANFTIPDWFWHRESIIWGAPYWLLGICQILSKSAVSWCILAILQNDTPDLLYVSNRGILHPRSHSKGAWGHQPAKKAKKCEKGPFWCFTLYWGENEWNSKTFSSQNQVLAWAPWWY